ncbi:MAG: NupC/NupG family nucleoside CNT transporter [Saprospiraceae bacterium]
MWQTYTDEGLHRAILPELGMEDFPTITDLLRGLIGFAFIFGCGYAFSSNRKAIDWRLVGVGFALQLVLALLILRIPAVSGVFDVLASFFQGVLAYSEAGAKFLFGNLITDLDSFGYIFAFQVLPTIVFFSALSSVLFYFGILQKIVFGFAWIMKMTMGLSGPESLAAAANVFIGQTEAPLVVKPYLDNMTRSEMLCLMVGGMATIAGGVFAAYVGFLGGSDPELQLYYAKHLLTASIISAPAAIVMAKMLYPETEDKPIDDQMRMSGDVGDNLLDAISRGTVDGLKLAINVGAMLLVFTALIFMANSVLLWATDGVNTAFNFVSGSEGNWNAHISALTDGRFDGLTFTYIIGLIFSPIAWLLGCPAEDMVLVGQLLGQKTVINEFVAYAELDNMRRAGIVLSDKGLLISTYALCGFANFASIGIQIGGIGSIAPSRRKLLTEFGMKALIGGTLACFLTAVIAGILG